MNEAKASRHFLVRVDRDSRARYAGENFIQLDLTAFTVYREANYGRLREEMASLQDLCVQPGDRDFYLNGIISYGQEQVYKQNVCFNKVSIGGYEDTSSHSAQDTIWIQSYCGRNMGDVRYRLIIPPRSTNGTTCRSSGWRIWPSTR